MKLNKYFVLVLLIAITISIAGCPRRLRRIPKPRLPFVENQVNTVMPTVEAIQASMADGQDGTNRQM